MFYEFDNIMKLLDSLHDHDDRHIKGGQKTIAFLCRFFSGQLPTSISRKRVIRFT